MFTSCTFNGLLFGVGCEYSENKRDGGGDVQVSESGGYGLTNKFKMTCFSLNDATEANDGIKLMV
jgi:hypothetical protein